MNNWRVSEVGRISRRKDWCRAAMWAATIGLAALAWLTGADALVHCLVKCPKDAATQMDERVVCLHGSARKCDTITTGHHVPSAAWLDEVVRKAQHRCAPWTDSKRGWTGMKTCTRKRGGESRSAVFASWLAYHLDPQRGKRVPTDSIGYVHNLYVTASHLGLHLVIFHDDHLAQSVIDSYASESVVFHRTKPDESMTTNDYRFVAYNDYLTQHAFDRVLMVDASDVFFNSDPFEYMVGQSDELLMSPDGGYFDKYAWMVPKCYPGVAIKGHHQLHNAGVWGGTRSAVRCVLQCMENELRGRLHGRGNCNMPALNWCVSHGPCKHSVNSNPTFVNKFRKLCREKFPIIHNKCSDTEHKICTRVKDGNVVMEPKVGTCAIKPRPKERVQVVYSADDNQVAGVELSIASLKRHASEPVDIHFIGNSPLLKFPDVHFVHLPTVATKFNLRAFANEKSKRSLQTPANFVRFVAADLFPALSKVIWLDADTIVKCDIVRLFRSALTTGKYAIAAVPRDGKYAGILPNHATQIKTSFNAGVAVISLAEWRRLGLTSQILNWAQQNRVKQIYHFGSQPPLALAVGEHFEHIDKKWNVGGLGWKPHQSTEWKTVHGNGGSLPPDHCILHWNGDHKHWHDDGLNKDLVPSVKSNNANEPVHVVYSADDDQVAGVEFSIASLKRHASEPVDIHFIGNSPLLKFPDVHFVHLPTVATKFNLRAFANEKSKRSLQTPANFVRFVVADLFPDLSKVIWLDTDTIVKCDIVQLFRSALTTEKYAIAAVPRTGRPAGLLGSFFSPIRTSFNAGVAVISLTQWRILDLTSQSLKWAQQNRKKQLYRFGSQPPLALAVGEYFEHLSKKWNVGTLGWVKNKVVPKDSCILHWNGEHKHWHNDGFNKKLAAEEPTL